MCASLALGPSLPMRILLTLALLTSSCASLPELVPGGGDLRQNADVHLGQRIFSAASANCLDEQLNFGGDYSVWREDGLFGYDLGVAYHRDRDTLPVVGRTVVEGYEVYGGLRKTFEIGGSDIRPYVGLGLTGWWADREEETPSSRDGNEDGIGVYERVGAWMPIADNAFVGADLRFIQEDFIQNGELDMDGHVISVVFGISF